MSTAPGRIIGEPSVKPLRKRFSGRVADKPLTIRKRYGVTEEISLSLLRARQKGAAFWRPKEARPADFSPSFYRKLP